MTKKSTVSAQVDDDLRKAARVKAAKEDRALADVIRDLLRQWLGLPTEQEKGKTK